MTGDLSEPAHGAAQQAYEAAARLYEQAAAELDQAAAHCRVAATHFRGAEVPRGAAHAGAALGHLRETELRLEEQLVPTASRRASRACVEDHQRPVTGGTYGSRCRRLGSPQSSERFQRRHRGARRNRQGDGDTAEGSVFGGGPETSGVVAGNRGAGPAAGGAAQGRGCPPPATRRHLCPGPLRHGRSGPGLLGTRHAHRPALPERTSSRRAPCIRQGQARCARPFGTLDGGAAVRSGSSRARASCWLASRAVLHRYDVMSSGVVKPDRMSQV
jgi:hypothetical protein